MTRIIPGRIVPDNEKLIAALDYQQAVSEPMDLSAVHRALCSAAPGTHVKRPRPQRIPTRGGGELIIQGVHPPGTPAPLDHDVLHEAAVRLHCEIVRAGRLAEGWREHVRTMTI